MRIDILTLFPNMIEPVLNESMMWRAKAYKFVNINVIDYRAYSEDKRKTVDDTPYGGGAGMVLRVEPVIKALRDIDGHEDALKILMTPQGIPFTQTRAKTLSKNKHVIIMCGHYEGYDERIRDYFDVEVSIGDYVLTSGEVAALVVVDAMVRLIPGVLSNASSAEDDSFSNHLLEYPQYTRPRVFEGKAVPDILLSGHHQNIQSWRLEQSESRTKKRRPDLYQKYKESKEK